MFAGISEKSHDIEHDYMRLSESPLAASAAAPMEDLKETELRLGLPGLDSPARKEKPLLTLGLSKAYGSGAKRGFSNVNDGSAKWVFSGKGGSEAESDKGGVLFCENKEKNDGSVLDKGADTQDRKLSSCGNDRAKAQVVGWPPIRSYRKNTMAANPSKNNAVSKEKHDSGCLYIKVSMDGAPYLRKVDLKTYGSYKELSSALEKMFSCFTIDQFGSHVVPSSKDGLNNHCLTDLIHGSEYVLTYEDKDGDWMLVGDVPWEMFTESCKRMRIMKGSEAIGLAPRVKNEEQKAEPVKRN